MMNKTIFFLPNLFLFCVFSNAVNASIVDGSKYSYQNENVYMQIIQKPNGLSIELTAPSYGLIGYKSRPTTTEQKIAFNRVMTILKNPRTFFAVNEGAGCRLSTKKVQHSSDKQGYSHGLNRGVSEFTAQYSYSCKTPSQIKDIKYHWFTSFPATKKISITARMNKGVKNGEVNAKSRRFYF